MEDYVLIEGQKINYILSSTPNNNNIEEYSTFLQSNNVKYLVNVGGSKYDTNNLKDKGIIYRQIDYKDGSIPNDDIIDQWCDICKDSISESKNIAIHCISGMGRAPTLICFSLIRYENYSPVECVEYVRKKRKNSLNSIQLKYIFRLRDEQKSCIIS